MRPHDQQWLADMATAADLIARFLDELGEEAFLASELYQSAVAYQLMVIGEAARRLGPEVREAHPELPLREAVGMRTALGHDYGKIRWEVVLETATTDVPALRRSIADLIEDPEKGSG